MSFAMQQVNCVLPKRHVLKKRLHYYHEFLLDTTIIKHLAGKKLSPTQIVAILDKHVQKYDKKVQASAPIFMSTPLLPACERESIWLREREINQEYFLELLLRDNPRALASALSALEKNNEF